MKIDPDGSLCRITSSFKDVKNNVGIIKVPNSEPSYKLIVIGSSAEHDELSDKSDEEISDVEFCDIKFPAKDVGKEKVTNKTNELVKQNAAINEEVKRDRNQYNRQQQFHKNKNNRYNRRKNTFSKISKHYKNLPNREIYNYGNREFNLSTCRDLNSRGNQNFNSLTVGRDFCSAQGIDSVTDVRDFSPVAVGRDVNFPASNQDFSSSNSATNGHDYNSAASGEDFNLAVCSRDFNSAAKRRDFNPASSTRDFNSAASNRNSNFGVGGRDHNFAANQSFTSTPNQDFNPATDHHIAYNTNKYKQSSEFSPSPWLNPSAFSQYSPLTFGVPAAGKPGLLGDHPSFRPPLPVFQSNQPNDQRLPYSTMASNFSTNNHNSTFIHNKDSSFSQKPSNYLSSKKTDNFINDINYRNDNYGTYGKSNQQRNNYNDNKRKQNSWNRGLRRHPNVRKFVLYYFLSFKPSIHI